MRSVRRSFDAKCSARAKVECGLHSFRESDAAALLNLSFDAAFYTRLHAHRH